MENDTYRKYLPILELIGFCAALALITVYVIELGFMLIENTR